MQKWTFIFLLSILWAACQPEARPEVFIPQMRAYAAGQQECVRLVWLMQAIANGNEQLVDSFAPGATITERQNGGFRQLRLAFGDSLNCSDGRIRAGTINMLAETRWPKEGSHASLFPTEYSMIMRSGINAVLHANAWEVHSMPPANGVFPVLEHRIGGARWQLGGSAVTWADTFQQVMIIGFDTNIPDDDLYLIGGETTVNLDAEAFRLRFAPPLSFRPGCDVITGGKAIFQPGEDEQAIALDFGIDECENSASIRIGEEAINLDLPD